MLKMVERPSHVREGLYYPWHPDIAAKYTLAPSFKNVDQGNIELWKRRGKWIVLPLTASDKKAKGKDFRKVGAPIGTPHLFQARSQDQYKVYQKSVRLLMAGKNHIIRAHPGWGKTVVGIAIANMLKKKTLIVVHKGDIAAQWVNAIKLVTGLESHEVGYIAGKKVDIENKPFVIAMIQSLSKQGKYGIKDFESFGLVIFDEVHRVGAEHFSQAVWAVPAKLRLGLSATPQRHDGRDVVFTSHIGPVLVTAKQKAMKFRVLVTTSGWFCPRKDAWSTQKGQYEMVRIPHSAGKMGHITKSVTKHDIRNDIITNFATRTYHKGRTTLIFSETKAHLAELEKKIVAAGVDANEIGMYVGGLSEKKRKEVLTKPILLTTYQYCSEGTDIPWADSLVFGTPRSNIEQIVGRILREHEGKADPLVLDIRDNDSPVYVNYAGKRDEFYQSKGADVRQVPRSKFLA